MSLGEREKQMLRSPKSLQHHHLLFHHSFRRFEDACGHFRSYRHRHRHQWVGLNSINANLPPLPFSFSRTRINLQFKSIQAFVLINAMLIKFNYDELKRNWRPYFAAACLCSLIMKSGTDCTTYENIRFNFQMFYSCELGKVVVCDFISDLQANHMSWIIYTASLALGFDPIEEVKRKFRDRSRAPIGSMWDCFRCWERYIRYHWPSKLMISVSVKKKWI